MYAFSPPSSSVLAAVAAHCCHLEVLDVSGCDQLSGATLGAFVEAGATRQCRLTIIAGGKDNRFSCFDVKRQLFEITQECSFSKSPKNVKLVFVGLCLKQDL